MVASARGQWTNPLPPLADSGLEIAIEEWLTIPASAAGGMRARINHVKPCPDGARLFCNDLRGKFWVMADAQATVATLFVDLAVHFPRFIDSPGLGTGFDWAMPPAPPPAFICRRPSAMTFEKAKALRAARKREMRSSSR